MNNNQIKFKNLTSYYLIMKEKNMTNFTPLLMLLNINFIPFPRDPNDIN